MTTPAAPQAPESGQPQPPAPQPQPQPQPPGQPPGAGQNGAGAPTAAEQALAEERARVKGLERELAQLRQAHMSDEDRRLAEAREEAARALAGAELRHLLTGRLTDPEAAIEYVDLSRLVKDGEPNRRAINALADKLAPAQQPAPPGRVPAGVREPAPEQDWLGSVIRR